MSYQVNDCVVHPAHGLGYIAALAPQRFFDVEARWYYEVVIQRNTVWVPIDASVASGLRPVTPREELTHYRGVLRSRPVSLARDHRQRRLELLGQLKAGLFQNLCEVVRDLTARRWIKTLNEMDSATLRKARERLCLEWAAAAGVPLPEAAQEIDALLWEGRLAHVRQGVEDDQG